ncbi:MAG: tripartite tricarboxylate transporter substrate binding protein [Hyphomicrobiaceae bacterium]|nr:tripartite tricarboxylate transporter substrate binding protein [Hyphomicrobiaceae bacterium]
MHHRLPSRRALLLGLAAGAALPALPHPARAETWPAKPIKVVVPFGAGSSADIVPRIVMEQLSAQLGQPIVIENRPGGGSTTGTAAVAKADADGYTLLATSSAYSVTPAIYHNLSYDPVKDMVPVATFGSANSVLIVAANAPYNTLAEFVAAAKAKPGAFNFASVGVGSAVHMAAERFRVAAGYEAAHVPFKSGSEGLTEVMAGRIDYYFCPSNTALPFIREGRLKALAVSPKKRLAALPDVPTTTEAGFPNSDYQSWLGLLAPARTPPQILSRLHVEIGKAVDADSVKSRFIANGVEPMPLTQAQFQDTIIAEIKANRELAKILAIKGN